MDSLQIAAKNKSKPRPPPKKSQDALALPSLASSPEPPITPQSQELSHEETTKSSETSAQDESEKYAAQSTNGDTMESISQGSNKACQDKAVQTSDLGDGSQEGTDATESKDGSSEKDKDDDVELTGIGREYFDDDDKVVVIDEGKWSTRPPIKSGFFAIRNSVVEGRLKVKIECPLFWKAFDVALKGKSSAYITKSANIISFTAPFIPLYFHYDEILEAARNELEDSTCPSAAEHLKLFEYWYGRWAADSHKKLRENVKSGWVTFEHTWTLFPPGELIYTTDRYKQPRVYVTAATVTRRSQGWGGQDDLPVLPMLSGVIKAYRLAVEMWYVDWDPSTQGFKRERETRRIEFFEGSRQISDFDFYPLRFYKDGNQKEIDSLLTQLRERGQRWKSLVSQAPRSMFYSGPATEFVKRIDFEGPMITKKENRTLNERVVVDHPGYKLYGEPGFVARMGSLINMFNPEGSRPENSVLLGKLDEDPDAPDAAPATDPFSDLQAQLAPSHLFCCLSRTTIWYEVTIAHLKPVEWQKGAIESLVIPRMTKQTLCDLVEEHKKGRMAQSLNDFIAHKGQGLVVVLHGPPGVGKTLTAEAIAEHTERPLYSTNIGELSSEKDVVSRLENLFELSVRWDAVLLIDEADVVLEERSYENMQRNAVVSVFLRMLEYYRGIIFLTTNRLGTMDVAFQSRVSLAVRFKSLTPDLRREIWLNFINRLDPIESYVKDELLAKLDELKDWKLNGRQIRNVLRMAQSIALAREKRRGAMRFSHVEQIANETLQFQDYFQEDYTESRANLRNSFQEMHVSSPGYLR